ncbi:MAG: hypothetical protein IPM18_07160 [Phycisphaerales bacterium]|nr:hypothetical protein [Phycisphaerales bacterium]
MNRSRGIQLVALLAAAVLVLASSRTMSGINAGRKQLNIMGQENPIENTPPEYVFWIQALGAFRGLIADIAFIRADQLKQEGRYYDAMQLHKWISDLQPYFPAVWEYNAWNMAWNISVTTFTPQERWNWVYAGVKLLRDQGIQFNPRAVNLYKQLAWTFNNKMGATTDEFHYAYKCEWAWRMHLVLGPPPNPFERIDFEALREAGTDRARANRLAEAARLTFLQNAEKRRARGQEVREADFALLTAEGQPRGLSEYRIAQEASAEDMRAIRDAAPSLDELYRRHPETREMVRALRSLGIGISDAVLTEDTYWREDGLAFTFFKPYRALVDRGGALQRLMRQQATNHADQARMQNLEQILGVSTGNEAGAALVRFLQRKVLLEVYKNDPADMVFLIEEFGPIDWRGVNAQSLYWTSRGLTAGGETVNRFDNDKTNTARILFFSLHQLWVNNRIKFEPQPGAIHRSYLNTTRDLNFIEPMQQAFLKYAPLFDPSTEGPGAGDTFRSGHFNFLSEAVRMLYMAGREADARHYYNYLREAYALTKQGEPNPAVQKSLDDFVMESFLETDDSPSLRDIMISLEGWLRMAFIRLADDDWRSYDRLMDVARRYHRRYVEENAGIAEARMWIPSFADFQRDVFGELLATPPAAEGQVLDNVRLWNNADLRLRQGVYDELLPLFEAICNAMGFDLARAFPEPEGMAEYRASEELRGRPTRDRSAETPAQVPGG